MFRRGISRNHFAVAVSSAAQLRGYQQPNYSAPESSRGPYVPPEKQRDYAPGVPYEKRKSIQPSTLQKNGVKSFIMNSYWIIIVGFVIIVIRYDKEQIAESSKLCVEHNDERVNEIKEEKQAQIRQRKVEIARLKLKRQEAEKKGEIAEEDLMLHLSAEDRRKREYLRSVYGQLEEEDFARLKSEVPYQTASVTPESWEPETMKMPHVQKVQPVGELDKEARMAKELEELREIDKMIGIRRPPPGEETAPTPKSTSKAKSAPPTAMATFLEESRRLEGSTGQEEGATPASLTQEAKDAMELGLAKGRAKAALETHQLEQRRVVH